MWVVVVVTEDREPADGAQECGHRCLK